MQAPVLAIGLALGALLLFLPGCATSGETVVPAPALDAAGVPVLHESQVDAWRAYLATRSDEDAWRTIPWSTTLADGVARADREGKPLLLWVMNGHPLGCT